MRTPAVSCQAETTIAANNHRIPPSRNRPANSINVFINGNRVNAIVTNKTTGLTIYTESYEYYTDKTTLPSYYTYRPYKWGGAYHKNPVKKRTRSYTDGRRRVYDYTYEYDAKGNITKEAETVTFFDSSGSITTIYADTYTYEIGCVQP